MKKWVLLLACCAPAGLSAQTSTTLSTYMAADASVDGSPTVVGATLSRETPWFGVRAGGAVDARLTPLAGGDADAPAEAGLWSAELDGMLLPGRLADHLPFRPYLVAGVGVRGMTDDIDTPTTLAWSYGAGARSKVLGPLHLEAEARYRQPFETPRDAMYTKIGSGLEVRAGMQLRFGGRRLPVARPVPAPAVPRALPSAPLATGSADAAAGMDAAAAARLAVASRALDTADDYLGVPYVWGGNTPASGFDCSGFVRFVFRHQGIELPRVSRDQAREGTPLPLEVSAFEPGDLLAFASNGGRIDHIAIYAGNGKIIHASASGRGVRVDDLYTRRGQWYLDHMVAARRIIDTPMFFATQ